ncbi:MAG: MBL fold metallo-hydrolase [Deltaproteobacteria bacterium]|nr:MBL fold metallo-hydrolase [Deltaproteobacteria bacterium]
MHVTRIQYPIGQGCFHAGFIRERNAVKQGDYAFHYVYDCGSDDRRALGEAIDNYKNEVSHVDALFVSHLDTDHVNGLDRLLGTVKVDTVYVPYINEVVLVLGLIQAELEGTLSASLIEASMNPGNWFRSRGVEHVVGVEESLDDGAPGTGGDDDPERPEDPRARRKIDSEPGDSSDQGVTEMGSGVEVVASGYRVPICDRPLDWTLVPHVDPAPRERLDRFSEALRKILGLSAEESVTSARLADAMRQKRERERLRECYEEIVPGGARRMHNRVSMSLYSGPAGNKAREWCYRILCGPDRLVDGLINLYPEPFWYCERGAVGWIGTGDATLNVKKVRTAWKGTYQRYRDRVATLLLPHHGSRRSFDCDVLDFLPCLKVCAASAGHPSRYGHPSPSVRLAAKIRRKAFLHVSLRPETALIEEIWTA